MWAFSDESERGERMLLSVLFVQSAALDSARADLRKLLLPGQRRVHTYQESPRRRRMLLDSVARLEATALVLRVRRSRGNPPTEIRRLLLTTAAIEVRDQGATRWILDDVERVQRARDLEILRTILGGPSPSYDHRPARAEPMLWAADAVCWAVGAGGDWRRRVSGLVDVRDMP